ncbi:MAG TPA: RNA 2'-phosphotransferase [Cytophagaceae bacterium]|nr:RNA 2'-phosphotransferase [Cytophagaceae bacterium]
MKSIQELTKIGKFLSLLLRHKPEEANLALDQEGWTDIETLLQTLNITHEELQWIVEHNNKQRFGYNNSKTKIRANQGHSLSGIAIEYIEVVDAPEFLYHGTAANLFPLLLKEGLKKMSRTHVHLSGDLQTAIAVGKRKSGDIVIIKVKAKEMNDDGLKLFISENGVYLTDFVPAKYLDQEPAL